MLVVQGTGTPDVIAQVVVELFPGRRPDQRQAHAECLGQGLGEFDIDAARLPGTFKTVGGEVFVDRHLQLAGGDHFVVVANLRLRHLAAQPHSTDQHREQTHGSLLDVHGVQISTHGPQGFLTQVVGHFRHVHPTVTHGAMAHTLDEPFIAGFAHVQHAQVRGDAT
ncbi:hypothetical protein D3C84_575160 [compost metagenome]